MPGRELSRYHSHYHAVSVPAGTAPPGAYGFTDMVIADSVGMSRIDLVYDPAELDPQRVGFWRIERGGLLDESDEFPFLLSIAKGWHRRGISGPPTASDVVIGGARLMHGYFTWALAFSWDPARSGWDALLETQEALHPEKMSLLPHFLIPLMYLARMGEHRFGRTNPIPGRWLHLLGSMQPELYPLLYELFNMWLDGPSKAAEHYKAITGVKSEHLPQADEDIDTLRHLIDPELFTSLRSVERWEPAVIRALDSASTTLWTRSPMEVPTGRLIRALLPIARWRRTPVGPPFEEMDVPSSLGTLEMLWTTWRSNAVGSRPLSLQLPVIKEGDTQALVQQPDDKLFLDEPEHITLPQDQLMVLRQMVTQFEPDEPFQIAPFITSLGLEQETAFEAIARLGELGLVHPSNSVPGCFEVSSIAAGVFESMGKPSWYPIVGSGNWQKADYLWRKYCYDWGPLLDRAELRGDEEARAEFLGDLEQLAATLVEHHEAWRLHQYLNYIFGAISSLDPSRGVDALASVYQVYGLLYWAVCQMKGQLLMGIRVPQVQLQQLGDYDAIGRYRLLWSSMPASVALENRSLRQLYPDIVSLGLIAYSVMPFLTGLPPEDAWHRLMVPQGDSWSLSSDWVVGQVERFLASVSHSVGQPDIISRDSWARLMQTTQLERRYVLAPNRPVQIRLPKHPVIRDVFLLEVDDVLVARVSTTEHKNILHVMPIVPSGGSDIVAGGTIPTIQAMTRGESSENYALNYFLGKLYQALVTLETVEGPLSLRRQRGKGSSGGGSSASAQKPEDKSIWQLIPRRAYQTQNPAEDETEILIEREELSPEELMRQERQRHFFSVVGHPRTLTGGRKPSLDRLNKARELGVFLLEGQTFVKPYTKGTPLAGEISADDMSRFLLRRNVVEADSHEEKETP